MGLIPVVIDQHPAKHDYRLSIGSRSTLSTINLIMKWLLALVPLVAAAPALPTFEGDAPDPGQVAYAHFMSMFVVTDHYRSKFSRSARAVPAARKVPLVPSSQMIKALSP